MHALPPPLLLLLLLLLLHSSVHEDTKDTMGIAIPAASAAGMRVDIKDTMDVAIAAASAAVAAAVATCLLL